MPVARKVWLQASVVTPAARAPLHHLPGLHPGECSRAECLGLDIEGAEQRRGGLISEPSGLDVSQKIVFEFVVAGHDVVFAALLAQLDVPPVTDHLDVADCHAHSGGNPRQGEGHEGE